MAGFFKIKLPRGASRALRHGLIIWFSALQCQSNSKYQPARIVMYRNAPVLLCLDPVSRQGMLWNFCVVQNRPIR